MHESQRVHGDKLVDEKDIEAYSKIQIDIVKKNFEVCIYKVYPYGKSFIRVGADKSFARPGRKQATATKLGIYSTYSPRSSIYFLARCSNFCKPLKKKNLEGCPSNQVSAAAMTSMSDEKWRPFNCFLSPENRW